MEKSKTTRESRGALFTMFVIFSFFVVAILAEFIILDFAAGEPMIFTDQDAPLYSIRTDKDYVVFTMIVQGGHDTAFANVAWDRVSINLDDQKRDYTSVKLVDKMPWFIPGSDYLSAIILVPNREDLERFREWFANKKLKKNEPFFTPKRLVPE